jgi:hypothetical protein
MDEFGTLPFDDVAHGRGDLWVIEVEGAEKRREAIDDDAVRRDLPSRLQMGASLRGYDDDAVFSG